MTQPDMTNDTPRCFNCHFWEYEGHGEWGDCYKTIKHIGAGQYNLPWKATTAVAYDKDRTSMDESAHRMATWTHLSHYCNMHKVRDSPEALREVERSAE